MQNQSGFSQESLIFSRVEAIFDECRAIEQSGDVLARDKLMKLIDRDISKLKEEARKLTGETKSQALSLVLTVEGRAHFAVVLCDYVEQMDRDHHLYMARNAVNEALGYDKSPLAYYLLGDVLRLSNRKADAAVAYRKVVDSGNPKLAPAAMQAIGQMGVSFDQIAKASQNESAAFGAKRKMNLPAILNCLKFLAGGLLIRHFFVNPFMLNVSIGLFVIAAIWGAIAYFNES